MLRILGQRKRKGAKDVADRAVAFWKDVGVDVASVRNKTPIIMLVDANARAGSIQSETIGSRAASSYMEDIDAAFGRFC